MVGAGQGRGPVRRADYLGDPERPLDESVRELVAERTGRRPEGPVRVLAAVRTLGYLFNPVGFYFCGEDPVQAVVAEVTNTPWGERHCYVLSRGDALGTVMKAEADKQLRRLALQRHGPALLVESDRAG